MNDKDIVKTSFINWVNSQINDVRLSNYTLYEDYYNGDQEVHCPDKVKQAVTSYLGIVDNFCKVIVDTPPEYIAGGGEIGIECRRPDGTPYPEAEDLLYNIYDDNGFLFDEIINMLTQSGIFGDIFLRMAINNDAIELFVDRPMQVKPRYASSNYRNMMWCAYEWFDRAFEGNQNFMKSQVFYNDHVDFYELGTDREQNSKHIWNTQRSEWKLVDSKKNQLGFIPIVHIKNNCATGLEFGTSDLHPVKPLQDALNKSMTDMHICMDTQAFQRIVFYGANPNEEDWILEPGSVIEIPDENGHMQVIQSETIAPYLMGIENTIDHICAVSSIPRLTFMRPTGFPVSGYALEIHSYPLDRKSVKKKLSLTKGLKELNKMIFYALASITGGSDYIKSGNYKYGISTYGKSEYWDKKLIDFRDAKVNIKYQGGLPVDRAMQTQINAMKINNGTLSKYEAMEEQGIENIPESMARIEGEHWQQFAMSMRMRGVEMGLQDVVEKLLAEQEEAMQKQVEGE